MKLEAKVAIVTGAARGIGQACALRLAKEGAKVVVADILEEEGRATVHNIRENGGDAKFIACDTGNSQEVQNLVSTTLSRFNGLDIVINNAAISRIADFLDVTEADFDAVLRVNLKGYFLVAQTAARAMVQLDVNGGSIINMSSVNAVMAIDTIAPYVISKGGVNQLTAVMSLSLAKHNIRVNAIGPGTIETSMSGALLADTAARQRVLSRTPIGRLGQPKEVANIALFLASNDSSYVTGQVIYADGGRLRLNYTVPVDET